jgi:hypothetical protein
MNSEPLSIQSEPHQGPNERRPLQASCGHQQVVIKGDRLANMEAAQKDLGDYERTFQNGGGKKVCGRPHRLFLLPNYQCLAPKLLSLFWEGSK